MLDRQKVILAFEHKRNQFRDYMVDLRVQGERVQALLTEFSDKDADAIFAILERRDIRLPGALPSHEWDGSGKLCRLFGRRWQTHEASREWAMEVLRGRPVIAVDGSQISPSKDFSMPVGAVQIGWYVNYHAPGGRYRKDIEFEVVGPDELREAEEDGGSSSGFLPDWLINQKRFVGECLRLCQLMEEFEHEEDERKPVCFLDGSFIISFAGQMRGQRSQPYVKAVRDLLACSERTRVPLVAYIDTSFSRDLVSLMHNVSSLGLQTSLSDAGLLRGCLEEWGDRSPLFYCAREDQLSKEGNEDFYRDVAFTYLCTVMDRSPSRVEMPRWLLEEGLAETVLDVVRAECVIGAGYPYAVETADATAVITMQDRERFYALWQSFMESEGVQMTRARKAVSKLGRR